MGTNIFLDKSIKPDDQKLSKALGESYKYWTDIKNYIDSKYPGTVEEWKNYGAKYGWNLKILLKKKGIYFFCSHTISTLKSHLFSGIRQSLP